MYDVLKAVCHRHHISVESVATKCGVSSSVLRRWEGATFPKPATLLIVAAALRELAGDAAAWAFIEGAGKGLVALLAKAGDFVVAPAPISIDLPFPPSSNTAYPSNRYGGGRHLSKVGKAWKEEAILLIKAATTEGERPKRLRLVIRLWMPDRRRRDGGNYEKLVIDALASAWGIDDNWTIIPEQRVIVEGILPGGKCILEVSNADD